MKKRTAITAGLLLATLVLCATFFARGASGQIAKVVDDEGRPFFVNAEPPLTAKLNASKPRTSIYLPAESSFSGSNHPAMDIGQSGTRKEERILPAETLQRVTLLRRSLSNMKPVEAMESLVKKLAEYPSNAAFLERIGTFVR